MRLSVHLFDEEVRDWRRALRDPEIPPVAPKDEPPFECTLVASFSPGSQPPWVDYLSQYFEFDWRPRRNAALALLVPIQERIFTVTFGNGRYLLDTGRTVPDFGVRVTANWLPEDEVSALGTRALGLRGRQQHTKVTRPAPIREFNLDLELDWVCTLAGVSDDAFARGMSGSECLHLVPREDFRDFDHLDVVLSWLLELYESPEYKRHFSFLDLLTPLRPTDHRVPDLDAQVVNRLQARVFETLGLTQPEPLAELDEKQIWRYKITGLGRNIQPREELNLSWLSHCAQLGGPTALDRVRITVVDRNGDDLATRPLRQYLTAEIMRPGDGRFVLSLGRWFRVDLSFAERIDREISAIGEINDLPFPLWQRGKSETEYLRDIEMPEEFHLLDAKLVVIEHPYGKVEICDLLTPDMQLIHVKKLRRSATLSHLFGQGSVSARLLAIQDPTFCEALSNAYRSAWPDRNPSQPATVVFAVAVDRDYRRDAMVHDLLPFFSKLNLSHHVRDIQRNFQVRLARINMVEEIGDTSQRIPLQEFSARPGDYVQGTLSYDDA